MSLKTRSTNNYEDKIRDQTLQEGERCFHHKITEEQARQIKQSKGDGSRSERANKFGVSAYIVADIDRGKTWCHVPDKDGHVIDNSDRRKISNERRKINKDREFTQDDWVEALTKLRNKSLDSVDVIHSLSSISRTDR